MFSRLTTRAGRTGRERHMGGRAYNRRCVACDPRAIWRNRRAESRYSRISLRLCESRRSRWVSRSTTSGTGCRTPWRFWRKPMRSAGTLRPLHEHPRGLRLWRWSGARSHSHRLTARAGPVLRYGGMAGRPVSVRIGRSRASFASAGGLVMQALAAVDFLSVRAMCQPLAGAPLGSARS